jgi:thioredoxin-like negative regulator of GroEL
MKPIVDGLEETYGEDFPFVRVDIDTKQGKQVARDHGFIGQPTFIFIDASGEEVRRLMGPQTPKSLEQEIERLLKK